MQDGSGAEGGIQFLLKILADGEEQARQLGELADDDPRSGAEHYRRAARRLQCTLGRAAAAAKAVEAASGSSRGTDDRSESPRSADESSGRTTAAVEAAQQERQPLCKRRKGLPRWTAEFRVPDANLEATPDDGFSWRKYGQKDILGAKFPRGYYRCTYRTAQGCQATKQVQRSDADLCVFDVTYQGDHTCHQKQRQVAAAGGTQSPSPPPPSHHEQQDPSMQLLMGFKNALKVETEAAALHQDSHDYYDHGPASAPAAPFSFPSVMPFHHHAGGGGEAPDNPATAAAAAFSSPPPAGTSYFSAPPPPPHHHCPAAVAGSCYDVFDYDAAPPGSLVRGAAAAESSELGEVVSRATTGFDYSSSLYHHHAELDPHLPFAPFGGPSSHGPYQ